MTDLSSMNRETRKKHLRSRIITPGRPAPQESSEEVIKKAHGVVLRRRLLILLAILIFLTISSIAYYWHQRSFQYKEATVLWERQYERDEATFVEYIPYGENLLRYSKDGASHIDSGGKDIWVQPYEMRAPLVAVNGDYAAIADKQGKQIYIFNKNGLLGTASTTLPITKITISSKGLVAAILEGQSTSHIYYYTKEGEQLKDRFC